LDKIIERCGKPLSIVRDNGREMTGRAVLQWTMETGIEWRYIAPGELTQNAYIERIASCATSA
jgi:putative transposase